jgi:hypothetical protein
MSSRYKREPVAAEVRFPSALMIPALPCPCPRCGRRMIIIETFPAGTQPTSSPAPTPIRIDTRDRLATSLAKRRSFRAAPYLSPAPLTRSPASSTAVTVFLLFSRLPQPRCALPSPQRPSPSTAATNSPWPLLQRRVPYRPRSRALALLRRQLSALVVAVVTQASEKPQQKRRGQIGPLP